MPNFLPAPQDATFRFKQPRNNVEAQSRVTYTRYSGVGIWMGSMTYAPMRDPGPLMVELQKADKTGGSFYVDLRKDATAVAGVSPTWGDAGKQFADSIEVPSSLQVRNGDLVSLRSSLSPTYVTARMIESWQQLGSTTRINFNAPIPTEFLTTALGARLQYSINRPHVRAVFEEDTMRWRSDPDKLARITTLSWREDLAAAISVLTQRATQSDVAPDRFDTAEDGRAIQAEDGRFIVLE